MIEKTIERTGEDNYIIFWKHFDWSTHSIPVSRIGLSIHLSWASVIRAYELKIGQKIIVKE